MRGSAMTIGFYALVFTLICFQNSVTFGISEQCPVTITSMLDVVTDLPFVSLDPELTFFREVLGFTDREIEHLNDDALIYFNETFGLDFSANPPDENNEVFYENARMRPSSLKQGIDYKVVSSNWVLTGNTHSICNDINFGRFGVTFLGDQLLHGTYGGEDGIQAGPGNFIFYGYFTIFSCAQSPVLIQYQSATPIRSEPIDSIFPLNYDAYNNVLGYGKALGYNTFTSLPGGKFHIVLQIVFTFPGN